MILRRLIILTAVILVSTAVLHCQTTDRTRKGRTSQSQSEHDCPFQTEDFQLKKQNLTVTSADGGILFTAGMIIDADGAPNAYGPHNRGLDYTANARGAHGWVALVTNEKGHPLLQKGGPYRGYYISTTSLQQANVSDLRNPKKYIDATKIPYIALPSDFAKRFDINLGDLAVVVNRANGRSAYAIFADVGPRGRIGEGSIALARALGIPANPRHDSAEDGITYLIFPSSGSARGDHITARGVRSAAARRYHHWGGRQRLDACELP